MANFSIYSLSLCGFTESQLLSIKNSILSGSYATDIASGKTLTSINAPGLSTAFTMYATQVEILQGVQYALQQLNPTLYGVGTVGSVQGLCL